MNDLFSRILSRVKEMSGKLTAGQKVAIAALVALLIAGVGGSVYVAVQPDYQVLYTNLDEAQGGQIIDELHKRQIPFKFSDSGGSLLVPANKVHELRLALASAGLAGSTGIGYELIDKGGTFGQPNDIIQLNKKRMLEGELARSIITLNEVDSARVHLALPKESLFVEDRQPASASVVLMVKPGAALGKRQVRGIVNLVSSAVTGLQPERITVVDQRGKSLSQMSGDMVAGSTSLEYQATLERELERKATRALESFLGVGKAVVTVHAEVDFSREQRQEELFDPEKQVVRSEQTVNEQRENGGNRVGGAAGAAANDPNLAQGVVRVGDASNASKEKMVTNYEINKIVRTVNGPGARLTRLSVAVIVDGTYEPDEEAAKPVEGDEEGAEPVMAYVPRSAAEMKTIKDLTARAVGIDDKRGDLIEVANQPFQRPELPSAGEMAKLEWMQWAREKLLWPAVAMLALVVLLLVMRPVTRYLTEKPEVAEVIEDGQLPPGEEQLALPGEAALGELEAQEVSVLEQIRDFARANPDAASAVIRFWLKNGTAEGLSS